MDQYPTLHPAIQPAIQPALPFLPSAHPPATGPVSDTPLVHHPPVVSQSKVETQPQAKRPSHLSSQRALSTPPPIHVLAHSHSSITAPSTRKRGAKLHRDAAVMPAARDTRPRRNAMWYRDNRAVYQTDRPPQCMTQSMRARPAVLECEGRMGCWVYEEVGRTLGDAWRGVCIVPAFTASLSRILDECRTSLYLEKKERNKKTPWIP